MDYNYEEICSKFNLDGQYISAQPYGEGHINDTLLINTTGNRFILQRVNRNVFKEPEKVLENVKKVTDFMHKKIMEICGDPYRETLTLISTLDDKPYYIAEDGSLFRLYLFIDHAVCYQIVENAEVFYQAARAFGRFQNMLRDFPADDLFETIEKFHDTTDRYRKFKEAIAADKVGRLESVKAEVEFALQREKDAGIIVSALANNEIPLRVTHNDTKLNNVMIDDTTGEGICVLDLDTVMPGSMLYDYGDSIRFGASTAVEDELDLNKVNMDLKLFEAYTKGYLEELGESITAKEAELLPMSAKLMTLECGVRFLTDYLDGDNYFRIHRPDHNLDRARTQFKLVADMEEKMDKMAEIVSKYFVK